MPGAYARLAEMLDAIVGRNAFWTDRLAREGFDAQCLAREPIDSPATLRRLPLTSKADLVADATSHPPYGSNLTYPLAEYVRFHQTSGTTGQPQPWLDTAASWDWFCDCWREIFLLVGVDPSDVVALPFSFGPFIGFWAAHDGAVRYGCLSLTLGGLSTEQRLREIVRHNATVVCCTPTYGLRMAEVAAEIGIDLADSSVAQLIVAGEPGGNIPAVRESLETAFGARVHDHWGMSDVGSLGIETARDPGTLQLLDGDISTQLLDGDLSPQCIAEVIDPQTGQPTADGSLGELVITNLGRWGMPVIRYRTGDLVRPIGRDAKTGRLRLEGGVCGRADDMLVIRGNNVFPSSVEAIVREQPTVAEFRLIVQTRKAMPHLRLEIEPAASATADQTDAAVAAIETACIDRLHFRAEVAAVLPGTLPRYELKARRVVRE